MKHVPRCVSPLFHESQSPISSRFLADFEWQLWMVTLVFRVKLYYGSFWPCALHTNIAGFQLPKTIYPGVLNVLQVTIPVPNSYLIFLPFRWCCNFAFNTCPSGGRSGWAWHTRVAAPVYYENLLFYVPVILFNFERLRQRSKSKRSEENLPD